MKATAPRPVTIKQDRHGWMVLYADRKYRGRYLAACFAGDMKTEEQVLEWVKNNPKLQLLK